jgi:hypothetical protein
VTTALRTDLLAVKTTPGTYLLYQGELYEVQRYEPRGLLWGQLCMVNARTEQPLAIGAAQINSAQLIREAVDLNGWADSDIGATP